MLQSARLSQLYFYCFLMLIPVILAGGSGSRLWPLSRRLHPKQFLPLSGDKSMLRQTLERLDVLPGCDAPIVVCHREHRFLVAEQLRSAGCAGPDVLLEPEGRNTAPAIAVGALRALQRAEDAVLLVLPADHILDEPAALGVAVQAAETLAAQEYLVTFGVPARAPKTGYGYIRCGDALGEAGFKVRSFVEKPSRELAQQYLDAGDYLWNSGMFLFGAAEYLRELERLAPEISAACRAAVQAAEKDLDFLRLPEEEYARCPADSIDYAVMEKTARAAVTPLSCGWRDAGAWSELWAEEEQDAEGNVVLGDVATLDARDCYLRSESRLLAALGVRDLVVVETADAVLVADRERAQQTRELVQLLESGARPEVEAHTRVYRPWGYYQTLESGERFQVKLINVTPGQRLSLQMHQQRAEHWVVVRGTATVVCEDKEFTLETDQSTYIPLGSRHRLANDTEDPLEIIEVQSGAYLGEDDIVRFDDVYGR